MEVLTGSVRKLPRGWYSERPFNSGHSIKEETQMQSCRYKTINEERVAQIHLVLEVGAHEIHFIHCGRH